MQHLVNSEDTRLLMAAVVLLLLLLSVCTGLMATHIENDLLVRVQSALLNANLPPQGVVIDGRDAYLTEHAGAAERAPRMARVVASVHGIRTVIDERSAEAQAPRKLPVSMVADKNMATPVILHPDSPWLRIDRVGGTLLLWASLSNPDSLTNLVDRAVAVGLQAQQLRVERAPDALSPPWSVRPEGLVDLLARLDQGRLTVAGDSATLVGTLPATQSDPRGVTLIARRTYPTLSWRFRLFLPLVAPPPEAGPARS